jgi:hypothetical protein
VKVRNLTNGLLVSLLFSVTAVEADSKYPATDFQPKVVYQDSSYKHSGSSAATTSGGAVSVADSNYPAANFQPKVLYQAKGYKHTEQKSGNATVSSSAATASTSAGSESASEGTSSNMLLGLMLVGVVGFLFYKKGNQPQSESSARRKSSGRTAVESNGDGTAVSGVARYLEGKAEPLVSGVAKYLEGRQSVAASGVSKYLAKQKVSERLAEAENASGVEKYLRDRG